MSIPHNFFLDYIILVPVISWCIAHALKVVIRLADSTFDRKLLMSSGGMPSVHSAFIVSLTTAIAVKHGITSTIFVLALCVTGIVLYDAMNVRFQAGKHAGALNKILKLQDEKKFNEFIGHTPLEVFVGSILGVIIGFGLAMI